MSMKMNRKSKIALALKYYIKYLGWDLKKELSAYSIQNISKFPDIKLSSFMLPAQRNTNVLYHKFQMRT